MMPSGSWSPEAKRGEFRLHVFTGGIGAVHPPNLAAARGDQQALAGHRKDAAAPSTMSSGTARGYVSSRVLARRARREGLANRSAAEGC